MLVLSSLEPVTSDEISVGNSYILLSSAQEQIYMLQDCNIEYIKIFGRPSNYGLFSCNVEEVHAPTERYMPFFECEGTKGMYKHTPGSTLESDLAIDWSR